MLLALLLECTLLVLIESVALQTLVALLTGAIQTQGGALLAEKELRVIVHFGAPGANDGPAHLVAAGAALVAPQALSLAHVEALEAAIAGDGVVAVEAAGNAGLAQAIIVVYEVALMAEDALIQVVAGQAVEGAAAGADGLLLL